MSTYLDYINEDVLYLILSNLGLDDFNSMIQVLQSKDNFTIDYLKLIYLRYDSYAKDISNVLNKYKHLSLIKRYDSKVILNIIYKDMIYLNLDFKGYSTHVVENEKTNDINNITIYVDRLITMDIADNLNLLLSYFNNDVVVVDLLYTFMFYLLNRFVYNGDDITKKNNLNNLKSYIFRSKIPENLEYIPELSITMNIIFLYIYMKDVENRKFERVLTLSMEDMDDIKFLIDDLISEIGTPNPYGGEIDDPDLKKLLLLLSNPQLDYVSTYVLNNLHTLQK
jgi:hypothetical protein